jgi:hypothetical protein
MAQAQKQITLNDIYALLLVQFAEISRRQAAMEREIAAICHAGHITPEPEAKPGRYETTEEEKQAFMQSPEVKAWLDGDHESDASCPICEYFDTPNEATLRSFAWGEAVERGEVEGHHFTSFDEMWVELEKDD